MFNPAKANKDKAAKAAKKKALDDIRVWSLNLIPVDLQVGLILDINEVICGDPSCAPIDTVFTLVWETGGKGLFALPLAPSELTEEELQESFPDADTLTQWKAGKKARWPPLPELRFNVGDRVECRIGPHPVKGWAPGRIVKLYYSEPNWPPNMVVPYQIALHDGRLIFAPQDNDQLIRLRPPAAIDAPSSPEIRAEDYNYEEGDDEDGEYMDEEEGEEHDEEHEDDQEEEGNK